MDTLRRTNIALAVPMAASVFNRSRVERASRSSRVTIRTSWSKKVPRDRFRAK